MRTRRGRREDGTMVGARLRRVGLFLLFPSLWHGKRSASVGGLSRPGGAIPHQAPPHDDRTVISLSEGINENGGRRKMSNRVRPLAGPLSFVLVF